MSCCMYQVYIEELINDINTANYVSLQADETDITCRSQFVIIYGILSACFSQMLLDS